MIDPKLEQEAQLLHNRICYALGDPKRVLLLYLLSDGPKCVNELVEALRLPQSTVSRHLRVLRERGLANAERSGTAVYYTLADPRVIQALDLLRAVLVSQLTASAEWVQSLGEVT